MPKEKERESILVDPKLIMERVLHYRERHHAWSIFRTMYWAMYFLVMGFLLIYYNALSLSLNLFLGIIVILFAIMLVIFGLVESLHHKFIKKYG